MFGTFKRLIVNNKGIKNGTIQSLAKTGSPMCLAYHTMGMYKINGTSAANHMDYTPMEHFPLAAGCASNYPKAKDLLARGFIS